MRWSETKRLELERKKSTAFSKLPVAKKKHLKIEKFQSASGERIFLLGNGRTKNERIINDSCRLDAATVKIHCAFDTKIIIKQENDDDDDDRKRINCNRKRQKLSEKDEHASHTKMENCTDSNFSL